MTGLENGRAHPERAWPEIDEPGPVALASHNSDSQTVTLVLVERFGQTLPEGSYSRRNRQAIAARETRIATRLRAIEYAYRMAIERDAISGPTSPPEDVVPLNMRPTGRSSWSKAPSRIQTRPQPPVGLLVEGEVVTGDNP